MLVETILQAIDRDGNVPAALAAIAQLSQNDPRLSERVIPKGLTRGIGLVHLSVYGAMSVLDPECTVLKALLEKGAKIDARAILLNALPIECAAISNFPAAATFLLESGSPIGLTLHKAAEFGSMEVLRALIVDKAIDPQTEDGSGRIALEVAFFSSYGAGPVVADFLIRNRPASLFHLEGLRAGARVSLIERIVIETIRSEGCTLGLNLCMQYPTDEAFQITPGFKPVLLEELDKAGRGNFERVLAQFPEQGRVGWQEVLYAQLTECLEAKPRVRFG